MTHAKTLKAAVATCVGIAALGGALPADAATLTRTGAQLTYLGGPGEANVLKIGTVGGRIYFQDSSSVAAAVGPGCDYGPDRVSMGPQCPAEGVKSVVVRLGDGNDETTARSQVMELQLPQGVKLDVDAGPGRDRVIGTKGSDKLAGGPGNDDVYGSGGRDRLSGGVGNDRLTGFGTLAGGPGNDFIGAFYGFSQYKPFASRVAGGSGSDRVLTGNKVRDRIDCGAGTDSSTSTDKRGFDKRKRCERRG